MSCVFSNQELKEPGMDEGSNFDMICPTIVFPKSAALSASLDLTSGNKVRDVLEILTDTCNIVNRNMVVLPRYITNKSF